MINKFKFTILLVFFIWIANINPLYADIVKKIEILGNDRISNDTILLFTNVSLDDDLKKEDINTILKNLYETNFFKDVSVSFKKNILSILVSESPIIENIFYEGLKSNKIKDLIKEDSIVKSRFSYNENLLKKEKNRLKILLKILVIIILILIFLLKKSDNLVDLTLKFNLGDKSKIKKYLLLEIKYLKTRN